ncbi:hypothetical protein ADL19_31525 [Streptomyces purpurogeneiscleroticus]|nr:hypothetical protein ADL19_31525 [Streptomyces purpurogeneiscleroticus]
MAEAAIRAFEKVGVPIFDPNFQNILDRRGLDAAVTYLAKRHKLYADEAKAMKANLELALIGIGR